MQIIVKRLYNFHKGRLRHEKYTMLQKYFNYTVKGYQSRNVKLFEFNFHPLMFVILDVYE